MLKFKKKHTQQHLTPTKHDIYASTKVLQCKGCDSFTIGTDKSTVNTNDDNTKHKGKKSKRADAH